MLGSLARAAALWQRGSRWGAPSGSISGERNYELRTPIVPNRLGDSAGVIGAALLAAT